MTGSKLLNLTEYQEQVLFVSYLQKLKLEKKIIEYFAIANENNMSFTNKTVAIIQSNKAKASGKKSGVSDICIILKNRVLFIEMKKSLKILKNGTPSYSGINVSDNQIKFIETVNKSDSVSATICYGYLDAKNTINLHLGINNG